MSERHLVEVWGDLVGVVIEEGPRYRFLAARQPYEALEGTSFPNLGRARLAAIRLAQERALEGDPTSPVSRQHPRALAAHV